MPTCQGKAKDGRPCSRIVKDGARYCWQHEPGESWREVYERLAQATPEEKTDIVLRLIEQHTKGKLELPERDGVRADLAGLDLSKDMVYIKRKSSKLKPPPWVILWGADIQVAVLEDANLKGAILNRANLQEAYLGGANLQDAQLRGVNLQSAKMWNANLQKARLWDANLQDTRLDLANLTGARLGRVNLQGANLSGANLPHAKLWGVDLEGATLEHANLQDADMGSDIPPPIGLGGANLRNVNLKGANLQGINLRGVDLQAANLTGANLQGANLMQAGLEGANLRNAKLQTVDLSGASLTHIHISGAWLDRTRLRCEQFGGAIGEELAGEYKEAKQGYLALKQNFDDLGDHDAASWAYRKERRMEKLEALQKAKAALNERKWGPVIAYAAKVAGDQLVELLCDYGESVWRVLFWMVALLFAIGPVLVGLLGGLEWTENTRNAYFSRPTLWQRWLYIYFQHILYMVDTFTTADFAELGPANDVVRLFSGFMAIVGIFLAGLLGFVAGNRIRRS